VGGLEDEILDWGKIRSQKLGQWLFITFVRYSHCGVLGGSSCILTALKEGGGCLAFESLG
jgi:hypothetical protein